VISTSIANIVSWSEKHRSAGSNVSPSHSVDVDEKGRNRLSKVYASIALKIPDRDTSIPFVVYGSGTKRLPLQRSRFNVRRMVRRKSRTYFFASCSILYPGLGSLPSPTTRANRSRQFPTAMSNVSPNIR
jgi:hypothetical protein